MGVAGLYQMAKKIPAIDIMEQPFLFNFEALVRAAASPDSELRKVIDEQMVSKVLKALTGGGTQMPKNWNRRFKHNRDKMKTGDIFELAEVVRNLSLRDHEKGLSTGEKQMFVKAKKILASELMYAKDMDEDEAAEWLDGVLARGGKKKTTAKVAATA